MNENAINTKRRGDVSTRDLHPDPEIWIRGYNNRRIKAYVFFHSRDLDLDHRTSAYPGSGYFIGPDYNGNYN